MTLHDTRRTDERAGLSEDERLRLDRCIRWDADNLGPKFHPQFSNATEQEVERIIADRLAAAVAKVAAVDFHRIVAAGPAYVMCACDMQRRDVPTYDAHLRAALTSPHPARDEHTSAGGACPTCGPSASSDAAAGP